MTETEVRRMFQDRGDTVRIDGNTRVTFKRFGGGAWRFAGHVHDYVTGEP